MRHIKSKVEHCLKEFPNTRNSDTELYIKICQVFFGVGNYIHVSEMTRLPNFEGVIRWRRKFNEKKKYVPTDWQVAKKRQWAENEWKDVLGYVT